MRDVETLLARIDERTMSILEKLEKHDELHKDLETRVRTVERFRFMTLGAAALASATSGLLGYFIKPH
jgi:hypothetical protein